MTRRHDLTHTSSEKTSEPWLQGHGNWARLFGKRQKISLEDKQGELAEKTSESCEGHGNWASL